MATPRADTYTAATGAAIYAGMAAPGGLPSWVTSMASRTWKKVPLGNTFMSIDPRQRADMNPSYPAAAPWDASGGHAAILDAWGSLIPSQSDGRLWAGPAGGHLDLAGNHQVVLDLMQEVPTWALLSRPSGALPGAAVTYEDGNDAAGVYVADGRVRGNHPYQNILHVPGTTKLIMPVVAATYPNAATAVNKAWSFDTETGAQSLACDYTALSSVSPSNSGENSGNCYDVSRNSVWHLRSSGNTKLVKINLGTGTATEHGALNTWVGGSSRLFHIPTFDKILNLTNISGGSGYIMFNPVADAWESRTPAAFQGAPSAGLSGGSQPGGVCGGGWVQSLGGVLVWNNDTATTEISLLTPNSTGSVWTWSVLAVSGTNTVTPPARVGGGGGLANALGKFGILPAMGLCYWARSSADDIYVFKY